MNGKPLPRIDGFRLGVVVFGYIGARSVKWLYQIKAIANPLWCATSLTIRYRNCPGGTFT